MLETLVRSRGRYIYHAGLRCPAASICFFTPREKTWEKTSIEDATPNGSGSGFAQACQKKKPKKQPPFHFQLGGKCSLAKSNVSLELGPFDIESKD